VQSPPYVGTAHVIRIGAIAFHHVNVSGQRGARRIADEYTNLMTLAIQESGRRPAKP
jgi:hypothetical protein